MFVTEESFTSHYFHNDYLGSARLMTKPADQAHIVEWRRDYYPYGADKTMPYGGDHYKFTGKERDAEIGLDYSCLSGEALAKTEHRYYDNELGRFTQIDPMFAKYPGLSPYVYAANNPLRFVDPDGGKLKAVKMMGLSKENPVLEEREYYVDDKISSSVELFVSEIRGVDPNLSVNNTFRLNSSASIITTNTKAKGLSRHQAGFAIDINGMSKLNKTSLQKVLSIAKKYGFSQISNPKKDPPHFSIDPTKHGYKSLPEAVEENKKDYKDSIQEKNSEEGKTQ